MIKILFPLTLLSFNSPLLFSETLPAEPPEEEHVAVGSKGLDEKARAELQARRSKEEGQKPSSQEETGLPEVKGANLKSDFMLAPARMGEMTLSAVNYVTALPVPAHMLKSVAIDSSSVEFEDGSHWSISPYDSYVLAGWYLGDQLTVVPDTSWFSSYSYYITNKATGTYVRADLTVGPLSFGPNSNWITGIDGLRHIYLQNGSIWCVDPRDIYLVSGWAINDHLIIGQEGDSWFHKGGFILINVNMDEYVRANPY